MADKKDLSKRTDLDDLERRDKSTLEVDETLLTLNQEIEQAFKRYFSDSAINLRFDIPDKETPPNDPTICIFLYDIQEDLELRHGQPRLYDVAKPGFAPGQVHVRCCYLITYWETKTASDTSSGPRSQSMIVMNLVLNALLNLKLTTVVPTFRRVIAPSQHLLSLGNFWQALGNKPRLCLNFAVTVPVTLRGAGEKHVSPVISPEAQLGDAADILEPAQRVASDLRGRLVDALREAGRKLPSEFLNAQLETLRITCWLAAGASTLATGLWEGRVSGLLDKALVTAAKASIKGWTSNPPRQDVHFESFDTSGLVCITFASP